MNTKTGFPQLVTALIVVLFTACKSGKEDKEPPEPTTQLIQRGGYLLTALTEGKFKGLVNGRTLLPPMAWPNFEAILAYTKPG